MSDIVAATPWYKTVFTSVSNLFLSFFSYLFKHVETGIVGVLNIPEIKKIGVFALCFLVAFAVILSPNLTLSQWFISTLLCTLVATGGVSIVQLTAGI